MLREILRDALRRAPERRRVLNVGGNNKCVAIPPYFTGWDHVLLDIDPRGQPDILCDARELASLDAEQFDAVYCSHNLEHYYPHDVPRVLAGFLHVLKSDGFVEIKVPDVEAVITHVIRRGMDIDDVLYVSPMGPITVHDVIYGFGKEIEQSGNDFCAHKTGFTPKRLHRVLKRAGFEAVPVFVDRDGFEIRALAFRSEPTTYHKELLELPET